MAEGTSHTGRLKDEIRKNKKKIEELKKQVEELQEQLKDHNENCAGRIKEIEDEIERLKRENDTLQKKVKEMDAKIEGLKESNTFLENEMKSTKKKLKSTQEELKSTKSISHENERKLKNFELSEDQLFVRQLCSSLQQNMCKVVLQDQFDPTVNKSAKDMEGYITYQIKGVHEQKEARKRWEKLKDEIGWKPFLIGMIDEAKKEGNQVAHPTLTEEKMKIFEMNLYYKEFSATKARAIKELTAMWRQVGEKLSERSRLIEVQTQSGARNAKDTSQYKNTYASKVAGEDSSCWTPLNKIY